MDLYLLSCRIKICLQHGEMVSDYTSERGGDQFEVNSELLNGEEQGRLTKIRTVSKWKEEIVVYVCKTAIRLQLTSSSLQSTVFFSPFLGVIILLPQGNRGETFNKLNAISFKNNYCFFITVQCN